MPGLVISQLILSQGHPPRGQKEESKWRFLHSVMAPQATRKQLTVIEEYLYTTHWVQRELYLIADDGDHCSHRP
jgi:hypothetical protein